MLEQINLFHLALAVFILLVTGIFLTYREFHQQTLEMQKRGPKKAKKTVQ